MFIIEVLNETTNKRLHMAHDAQSGGYPWFTDSMHHCTRFNSFEAARSEYQRMISAGTVKMHNGAIHLPTELRNAAKINGHTVTTARLKVSIIEVTGDSWLDIAAVLRVSHTVDLREDSTETSVNIGQEP